MISRKRLLAAALPWALVCASGLQHAHADIYTWTDESGRVNVSNLTPPDGVHVTKVVHENPHVVPARPAAVADPAPQADVVALALRVRQLEYEVELAKRQPPPPIYMATSTPPPMQYEVAPVQYGPDLGPSPASYGCDPSWFGCAGWFNPGFYPAGVVVLGAPNVRRSFSSHGGHHFAMRGPGRPPSGFGRR